MIDIIAKALSIVLTTLQIIKALSRRKPNRIGGGKSNSDPNRHSFREYYITSSSKSE